MLEKPTPPEISIVENVTQLKKAIKDIHLTQVLACDTETTGLDPLDGAIVRLLQINTGLTCYIFDLFKFKKQKDIFRDLFEDKQDLHRFIFHNAKFDVKMLKTSLGISRFGRVFCTYLASQILSFGKVEYGHSLKEVTHKLFDIDLDKGQQLSNWSAPVLTKEQLEYAAEDTFYLLAMRDHFIEQFKIYRLVEVATIEMECIEPTIEMELNGFLMDYDKWVATAKRNESRVFRMHLKISEQLSPQNTLFAGVTSFKVSSDKQLKERMKAVGIELPTKWNRKAGEQRETIEIDYLEKIRDVHPVIPMMIKCSGLEKSVSSYGENWGERIHPSDGRIHTDYKQIGTLTGRFSCNLHQVPRDQIYRKRFIAGPGNRLVWADYSQMELRILAFMAQDRAMLKAFIEGKDIHTYTASLVFKVPYDKVDKKIQRMRAKNLNFGIVYGIGADRFARNAEITEKEAEKIIADYFEAYSGIYEWLQWAKKEARYRRRSVTLANRLVKYQFDPKEKWQVSMAERNGMNTPIQGSNADITKLAMRYIFNELGDKAKLIHCVHDELIMECKDGDQDFVGEKMRELMTRAAVKYLDNVPVVVDVHSGLCWGK